MDSGIVEPRLPRLRAGGVLAGALLCMVLVGCGGGTGLAPQPVAPGAGSGHPAAGPAPTAREGRPAKSTRVRFVPERLTLAGGAASVEPAQTVDGELQVPSNVDRVGWWDGSAYVGDPFGSTVIAGHVDSATEGIGFFAKLLGIRVGAKVTLQGNGHRVSYRVVATQTVAKDALASDSQAFDQTGDHRLVLITCTGVYHPDQGGYDRNLVVIARPLGTAR
jgi:LPXTG-site transpeptidase (sortase) family protein